MTSTIHQLDGRRLAGGRPAAAALLLALALAACGSTLGARASLAPEIDLTDMSLEELLDLEVVPARCRAHPRDGQRGTPS